MDPELWELYEEGDEEDEVSVILRLTDKGEAPADVRVIASFGKPTPKIITARCRRRDIQRIHDSDLVVSMKARSRVEQPKAYAEDNGVTGSEVGTKVTRHPVGTRPESIPEKGTGVMVGICDWGFDFTHENFRNADGTTRFQAIWDQSAEGGDTPMPYGYGRVYTREDINRALAGPDPTSTLGYHPSKRDPQGKGCHGTHVLDILAGNRREPGSQVGLASDAEIVCVDLAKEPEPMRVLQNLSDSVRLLEGLDFIRCQAGERSLVMHLSAGKTGGPHDWTGLFERAVDAMVLERPGIALCQSVGNYAESRMHVHGRIRPEQERVLHWLISSRDRTPNELEIWYSGEDRFDLTLVAPNGARFKAPLGENVKLVQDGARWGTLYHRWCEPNSRMNHIDIYLRTGSSPGHYRIELRGLDVVDGRFHAWIERDAGGHHQSRFPRSQATPQYTTNTICNSYRGIAVGAYDGTALDRPPTPFSSCGPTADGRQKPELAAPGKGILAARSLPAGGWKGERRLTVMSGTSMAAPCVSGTVALMMQAAGRPLTISEVRLMLIGTTDPIAGRPGRSSTRLGYGYLNTIAAVEAARKLATQESADEGVASGDDERGDSEAEWALPWVVDPQPFAHHAEDALAADGEDESSTAADFDDWAAADSDDDVWG